MLLVAGLAFWLRPPQKPERLELPAIESPPAVAESTPPPLPDGASEERPVATPIDIPAPPLQSDVPLPELGESDPEFESALTERFGIAAVEQYLKPEHFVRNLVVTVDNLSRAKLTLDKRPLRPTPGAFVVEGAEGELAISAENYERYTPFVSFVDESKARAIVRLYRAYYPLLQQAYEELGNPEPSFNTRLVEVIDHLLATPEVEGPIKLVRKSVRYEYADQSLASLSSGQKILIRMGAAHAATIKRKLREIRSELAAAPERPGG